MAIPFWGKVIDKIRLYLNEMQSVFSLGDEVQFSGFPGKVAIADAKSVPP